MSYQNMHLVLEQPGIYVLTVDRPRALNALDLLTLDEIADALQRISQDQSARALLITGAGEKAVIAGGDISSMRAMNAIEGLAYSERGMSVIRSLESLPVPVIALVNGYALGGGCELALGCDWIIASERAVFGQPEVNLGIPPGFGGTQRLARRVGRARATELVTTGRQVKADEALSIGLVSQVVRADELMAKGLEVARLIAAKAPLAVRACKQLVLQGLDVDLASGCALETSVFAFTFGTQDRVEGMTAFLEKRPANFQGK